MRASTRDPESPNPAVRFVVGICTISRCVPFFAEIQTPTNRLL